MEAIFLAVQRIHPTHLPVRPKKLACKDMYWKYTLFRARYDKNGWFEQQGEPDDNLYVEWATQTTSAAKHTTV